MEMLPVGSTSMWPATPRPRSSELREALCESASVTQLFALGTARRQMQSRHRALSTPTSLGGAGLPDDLTADSGDICVLHGLDLDQFGGEIEGARFHNLRLFFLDSAARSQVLEGLFAELARTDGDVLHGWGAELSSKDSGIPMKPTKSRTNLV